MGVRKHSAAQFGSLLHTAAHASTPDKSCGGVASSPSGRYPNCRVYDPLVCFMSVVHPPSVLEHDVKLAALVKSHASWASSSVRT